ncbi:MAG: hypothetical protein KAI26_01905 [Nanoarchaeota archaeon]|nr:hypothetical protein [Nanoarchaeota archaeon]
MGKKITINNMLSKFPRKNKYTPRKDMYITRENTYIIKNDLFGIKPVKITIEGMLSKSPRKNKYIAKNDRFGIKPVCAVLAGVFAIGYIASAYMNPIDIQKIYPQPIEGRVVDSGINFSQEAIEIQDNIKSKRLSKSKLTIPDDIPDYLSEAIAKNANFRLTEEEEKMVARWDPLLDYISTIDFFKNGNSVDPIFMRATLAVEARGDPKACSDIYLARGLGQIRENRGRTYCKWILKEGNLNLKNIAKDIAALGYDARFINEDSFKNFEADFLYDSSINLLLSFFGYHKNTMRFNNRLDLHCAEWNAGLGRGINSNQVANIDETINYIGKVNALYTHWHKMSAERDGLNYMANKTKVALNRSKSYSQKQ